MEKKTRIKKKKKGGRVQILSEGQLGKVNFAQKANEKRNGGSGKEKEEHQKAKRLVQNCPAVAKIIEAQHPKQRRGGKGGGGERGAEDKAM